MLSSDDLMSLLEWLEYLHTEGLTLEEVINGIKDGTLTEPDRTRQSISQ